MSTRGLLTVVHDGKNKIADFIPYDAYLSYQGVNYLEFCQNNLRTKSGRKRFIKQLGLVEFVTEDQYQKLREQFGSENTDILNVVNDAKEVVCVVDASDFEKDGLFCEWQYIIDFDYDVLKVYHHGEMLGNFSLSKLPTEKDFLVLLKE